MEKDNEERSRAPKAFVQGGFAAPDLAKSVVYLAVHPVLCFPSLSRPFFLLKQLLLCLCRDRLAITVNPFLA